MFQLSLEISYPISMIGLQVISVLTCLITSRSRLALKGVEAGGLIKLSLHQSSLFVGIMTESKLLTSLKSAVSKHDFRTCSRAYVMPRLKCSRHSSSSLKLRVLCMA
ncbi:hypothetical protein CEXT_630961 [Caerostris extrusa]|uniref:Uncharacterized protein n=1 Tax=Caerostris extrusa TaxID=172846 RepID=A0AAV4RX15_CAEEX|nr:hypothetical protein CEXT_630961 [Caerostris extrusa]